MKTYKFMDEKHLDKAKSANVCFAEFSATVCDGDSDIRTENERGYSHTYQIQSGDEIPVMFIPEHVYELIYEPEMIAYDDTHAALKPDFGAIKPNTPLPFMHKICFEIILKTDTHDSYHIRVDGYATMARIEGRFAHKFIINGYSADIKQDMCQDGGLVGNICNDQYAYKIDFGSLPLPAKDKERYHRFGGSETSICRNADHADDKIDFNDANLNSLVSFMYDHYMAESTFEFDADLPDVDELAYAIEGAIRLDAETNKGKLMTFRFYVTGKKAEFGGAKFICEQAIEKAYRNIYSDAKPTDPRPVIIASIHMDPDDTMPFEILP